MYIHITILILSKFKITTLSYKISIGGEFLMNNYVVSFSSIKRSNDPRASHCVVFIAS